MHLGRGKNPRFHILTKAGNQIVVVNGKTKNESRQANARLIAAAPELLEALEEARRELYELAGEQIGSGRYSKLDAAVTKATGDDDTCVEEDAGLTRNPRLDTCAY